MNSTKFDDALDITVLASMFVPLTAIIVGGIINLLGF